MARGAILKDVGPRAALVALAFAGLTAAPAAAGPAASPVLWNGAAAGMSVDQVYALFPGIRAAAGQTLEDGALEALSLDATVGGAPAEAIFFFRDKALDAVLVERTTLERDRRAQNLAEAGRLVGAATAQYGSPSRCVERRDLAVVDCAWLTHGLKIAIAYHDFGGGSPALSILYRAAS